MTVDGNAIFILCMYFLPTVIAALRRHHNQNAIFLTNLSLVDGHRVGRRVDMVHRKSSWPLLKRAPNALITRAWIDAALFV